MHSKHVLLALIILTIVCRVGIAAARAEEISTAPGSPIQSIEELENKVQEYFLSWNQSCSCTNRTGVPHTSFYNSATDSDRSCYSKCVREANQ
jgi:hypothetical protein